MSVFRMVHRVRDLVFGVVVLFVIVALVGSATHADDIRLIDGKIVRGKATHRVANGVVIKRVDGKEEILHPRMIKEIRVDGSNEWVSLADVLDGDAGPADVAPTGAGTDKGDAASGPSERAVHLRIDLDLTSGTDAMEVLDAAWSDLVGKSPKGIVISIDGVRMDPEVAMELASRLRRLDRSVPKHLVLGDTNLSTLVLVGAVDEVSWLPEGRIAFETVASVHHSSFRDALVKRIPRDAIDAMVSGGRVFVDRDGKLSSTGSGRSVASIEGETAVSCGLASAVLDGDGASDLTSGLPEDRRWSLDEMSLQIRQRRAAKDEEDNARRLEKAAEFSKEIASAAAGLRSSAKAFDDFYELYDVWEIWKKDAVWKSVDLKNQSRDLQGAVRDNLLTIKNRARTLKQIVQALPDTEPLRAKYEACVEAAEAALDTLKEYEKGLSRNAQEAYERGRRVAQSVRIGGC